MKILVLNGSPHVNGATAYMVNAFCDAAIYEYKRSFVEYWGAEDVGVFTPDDTRNFSPESLSILRLASRYILYLINEGYDLKQATAFVGNHFMLSERQRLAIMRSLATIEKIEERKIKKIPLAELSGREVWVDGFNTTWNPGQAAKPLSAIFAFP